MGPSLAMAGCPLMSIPQFFDVYLWDPPGGYSKLFRFWALPFKDP